MIYKNEKLNITVRNAEFFEIVEQNNRVELFSEQRIKMFTICAGSIIKAYDNSRIEAYGGSIIKAYDNSSVEAYDKSSVEAYDNSRIKAYAGSIVEAFDKSRIEAYAGSIVEAFDKSNVEAYVGSRIKAFDESNVEAYYKSKIEAKDFSCVYVKSNECIITQENHFGAIIKQVFILENDIIVYKKLQESKIAALLLKKGQVFQSQNHYKCRTNEAFVMAIESIDKTQTYQDGFSQFDSSFVYKVGETVKSVYDEDIEECSDGIHFFLTREQAVNY